MVNTKYVYFIIMIFNLFNIQILDLNLIEISIDKCYNYTVKFMIMYLL